MVRPRRTERPRGNAHRVRAALALLVLPLVGLLPTSVAGAQGGPAAGFVPNDPGAPRQWGLDRIGATTAWETATGDGIVIAVVDSGVDVSHPDLAPKVTGAADCVGHDDLPGGCLVGSAPDDAGHGTHVAGIALALTDNGIGVAGVAPRASLLAVKVLSLPAGCTSGGQAGCDAEGTEIDVAEGIRWAVDNGADVVNLSLGSIAHEIIGPGRALREALDYAWANGAIAVIAGGNDTLPGSLLDVPAVVVAATDRDDQRAGYSSGVGNVRWGIAAPGGLSDDSASCESTSPRGILSTWFNAASTTGSSYACLSGTSMAAPFVSGALAVLRSAGLDPQAAVDRLLAGATDLGSPGRDLVFGYGRVDLARSLAGLPPTGQPVQATQDGPPATVEPPTPTTVPATMPTVPPTQATTPPTVPATVPPTTPPPVAPTTIGSEVGAPAIPTVTLPGGPATEELPAAASTVAVLLVVGLLGTHGWLLLSGSSLFRRTPSR